MDIISYFSWLDICLIPGWPIWLPLGFNTLLLAILIERLWYLWKPIRMRRHWSKGGKQDMSQLNWESLLWQEKKWLYMSLSLLRNMIIIVILLGFLGSLINAVTLLNQEGISILYKPSMRVYGLIKCGMPMSIGLLSALISSIILYAYTQGSSWLLRRYSEWFPPVDV
ncbi:MAG: hypothetical protein HAW62_02205 [Endozoicomonadaceae bacterium]|nr:hypothetical protein [Endozoicomonadaceae bacterium]